LITNALIVEKDFSSKSVTRNTILCSRKAIMRFARSVDGVSELELCSAEPAKSGSCYVSSTGTLCAIWRGANVRSVENNMYHSASAEVRYSEPLHESTRTFAGGHAANERQ
jgi:hypothetical protein